MSVMNVIAERKIGDKVLRVTKGDITERNVDAIINAANSHLQHGGGVAAAIVGKGGRIIQEESDRIGFVPVGGVALTSAGKLPCRFVIHAVGPRMGEGDEDEKLKNAVRNSIILAAGKGFRDIVLPAISSGIFGFPKERCAEILIGEARTYLETHQESSLESIEFCLYDDVSAKVFHKEFEKDALREKREQKKSGGGKSED